MSAPPKTVVSYAGLAGLARRPGPGGSGPGGSGVCSIGLKGAGVFGTPLRFALPEDFTAETPEAVLGALGVEAAGDPSTTLERLIDARAAELPLPDGCLVVPANDAHRAIWPDPLAALAVLAKSSESIWLRAKTPSLVSALERRRASLLVPPRFAQELAQAPQTKSAPRRRPR